MKHHLPQLCAASSRSWCCCRRCFVSARVTCLTTHQSPHITRVFSSRQHKIVSHLGRNLSQLSVASGIASMHKPEIRARPFYCVPCPCTIIILLQTAASQQISSIFLFFLISVFCPKLAAIPVCPGVCQPNTQQAWKQTYEIITFVTSRASITEDHK